MDLTAAVLEAERRIRPHVRETPLVSSADLGAAAGVPVHCKLENLQHTGSFKVRGALNKLLGLAPAERERGVVAASTGNHGAAVAFGAKRLGIPAIVFVPETAASTKLDAIRGLGAVVRFHGTDGRETEVHARAFAASHGMTYVSPYNDPAVVAGQGTIGVELAQQAHRIDVIYVALGGGGLVSGIAAYLRSVWPQVRVVACSPANSPVMAESVKAGRILELESQPTLSDGTAGGVERDAITFDLCRRLVDEYVLVSETEIAAAMRRYMGAHEQVIEGAAGVAIAGMLRGGTHGSDEEIVVVMCGGNVSPEVLQAVLG